MDIKVLGTGCPKCKKLEANTKDALKELGKDDAVEKITDVEEIMTYGVMSTPALVVDGEIKVYGKVPRVKEIIKMLS